MSVGVKGLFREVAAKSGGQSRILEDHCDPAAMRLAIAGNVESGRALRAPKRIFAKLPSSFTNSQSLGELNKTGRSMLHRFHQAAISQKYSIEMAELGTKR